MTTFSPRLLALRSTGDLAMNEELAGSNAAADLYLDRLRASGGIVNEVLVDDVSCGHDDYLGSRTECGWNVVLDELETAFAGD